MRDFWETTPVATQQRAVHQHARHRDSTQSAALHPLRSAAPITKRCTRYEALHPLRSTTPVKERCTRSERVQCLLMGCTAPSATSTNAELLAGFNPIGNIHHDQKGLNLTDRNPSQQARVRIDAHSWHPLPGRSVREFQARTQRQNARGRGEARTTGRYLGSFTQKLHVIYLGQFSTGTTNVAIATTVFQNLKG